MPTVGDRMPTTAREAALLAARALLGVVFIAHGWQKLNEFGIDGTAASFDQMGVPAPRAAAIFAAAAELGGGICLLLGLFTALAGAVLVVDMVGAFWFVHRDLGPFVTEGGWELVAVLAVGALLFAVRGPGLISLDRLVVGRFRSSAA